MHPCARATVINCLPGARMFTHVLVCYVCTSSSRYAVRAALPRHQQRARELGARSWQRGGSGALGWESHPNWQHGVTCAVQPKTSVPCGKAALLSWTPMAAALGKIQKPVGFATSNLAMWTVMLHSLLHRRLGPRPRRRFVVRIRQAVCQNPSSAGQLHLVGDGGMVGCGGMDGGACYQGLVSG